MNPPVLQNPFRVAFLAFGIGCFIFAFFKLSHWIRYERADVVVGVRHPWFKDHGVLKQDMNAVAMNGTNPALQVQFMKSSGSIGGLPDAEMQLPAGVKPGDHVTVLYRPEANSEVVYSFGAVWRVPICAAVIGAACISLGFCFRRWPGHLFRRSHGYTA